MNKIVPAGAFKAHCLQLMEEVRLRRGTIVITKRGKPVAKLVPVDEEPSRVLGAGAGSARLLGDITAPVAAPEDWSARS